MIFDYENYKGTTDIRTFITLNRDKMCDEALYTLIKDISGVDLRGKDILDIDKFLSVCKEQPVIIEKHHDNAHHSIYVQWFDETRVVFDGTLYPDNRGGVPHGATFDDE